MGPQNEEKEAPRQTLMSICGRARRPQNCGPAPTPPRRDNCPQEGGRGSLGGSRRRQKTSHDFPPAELARARLLRGVRRPRSSNKKHRSGLRTPSCRLPTGEPVGNLSRNARSRPPLAAPTRLSKACRTRGFGHSGLGCGQRLTGVPKKSLCHITLYYIILYYTILHYITLYYMLFVIYYIMLHWSWSKAFGCGQMGSTLMGPLQK